jgi:hydrogenase maturation protein HypF
MTTAARSSDTSILAVGAQQKATFTWNDGSEVHVSGIWGDLEDARDFSAFRTAIQELEERRGARFTRIAHDLHPEYHATRYALDRSRAEGVDLIGVQHHHAHLASCLAEHEWTAPVLGVVFDGTGYGSDGRIWGGEFLAGDRSGVERAAHLRYVAMPGGAQAVREPWRMAFAHLRDAGLDPDRYLSRIPEAARTVVNGMIEASVNAPLTSSSGRLFDAAAALLGLCDRAETEGQGPIALEALADGAGKRSSYGGAPLNAARDEANSCEIDTRPLIRAIAGDLDRGRNVAEIAASFHATVTETIVRAAGGVAAARSLETIALTGGVFQNRLLREGVTKGLEAEGFRVLAHQRVSPGDAGISLGQWTVAAARSKK